MSYTLHRATTVDLPTLCGFNGHLVRGVHGGFKQRTHAITGASRPAANKNTFAYSFVADHFRPALLIMNIDEPRRRRTVVARMRWRL